jgi:hypothetical protein
MGRDWYGALLKKQRKVSNHEDIAFTATGNIKGGTQCERISLQDLLLGTIYLHDPKPGAKIYIPFCSLNLSQLSFNVLNTVAAMSLVSVLASCGSYA